MGIPCTDNLMPAQVPPKDGNDNTSTAPQVSRTASSTPEIQLRAF